jgi:hypothetical protein
MHITKTPLFYFEACRHLFTLVGFTSLPKHVGTCSPWWVSLRFTHPTLSTFSIIQGNSFRSKVKEPT